MKYEAKNKANICLQSTNFKKGFKIVDTKIDVFHSSTPIINGFNQQSVGVHSEPNRLFVCLCDMSGVVVSDKHICDELHAMDNH